MTLSAKAVLERVAQGKADVNDAEQLRAWLFLDEQTQIIKAYLVLACNSEKAKGCLAADLRLSLASYLLCSANEAMDRLELRRLFNEAIDLYDQLREEGYDANEARAAAVAAMLEEIRQTRELMKDSES